MDVLRKAVALLVFILAVPLLLLAALFSRLPIIGVPFAGLGIGSMVFALWLASGEVEWREK